MASGLKAGKLDVGKDAEGSASYKGGPLPDDCPPLDSVGPTDGFLLRLVAMNPAHNDDFRPGNPDNRPKWCELCTWLACSFWLASTPRERLLELRKYPKMRNKKYIAHVKVDPSCGKIKPHDNEERHIKFWMFEDFHPENAVQKYEPLL